MHRQRGREDRMGVEDDVHVGARGKDVAMETPFGARAPVTGKSPSEASGTMSSGFMRSLGRLVGVMSRPPSIRCETLPDVPWLSCGSSLTCRHDAGPQLPVPV